MQGPATPDQYNNLITSEHNQQPKFMAMIGMFAQAGADIVNGFQAIGAGFDLDTAIGAQLDILGLWIGQSRVIAGILTPGFFGFADDEAALPFGELTDPSKGGIWYDYGTSFSGSTVLNDAAYRTILRARIVRNQSKGEVGDIENALMFIFGATATVADTGNNSLAITVTTPVTPIDQTLLTSLDILPRPAGVVIGSITFAT